MIFEKTKNSCLFQGDSREVLNENFSDNSVDSFVCDPPYGLKFMGKDWDHGIPGVPYWAEMLRVAQPGAYLLAFGGTRTSHRLACAIEDAGWEIRDTMMWVYGSGFPKSHNISKAIDKEAGCYVPGDVLPSSRNTGSSNSGIATSFRLKTGTNPQTEEAKRWDGWGTALKPAWEPIIMARKPLIGTIAENVLRYGTGGLNIGGCRVGTEVIPEQKRGDAVNTNFQSGGATPENAGRWPANLIWSHSPNCRLIGTKRVKGHKGYPNEPKGNYFSVGEEPNGSRTKEWKGPADNDGMETVEEWECSEDCPSKGFPSPHGAGHEQHGVRDMTGETKGMFPAHGKGAHRFGDTGSASRFFKSFKVEDGEEYIEIWECAEDCPTKGFPETKSGVLEVTKNNLRGDSGGKWNHVPGDYKVIGCKGGDSGSASRFFYCAKSSGSERNKGVEDFYWKKTGKTFIRISLEEYNQLPEKERAQGNVHPTVKPVSLCQYLCRLVTPPGGVIVDPFMGSGSMGLAAILEGFRFQGIDNDPVSFDIARARIQLLEKII